MVHTSTRKRSPLMTNDLYTDMDRIFKHMFGAAETEKSKVDFRPEWDVAESEQGYELNLELPGLANEDIDIEVVDETLIVRGEKKIERKADGKQFLHVERRQGKFERRLKFPLPVDFESVEARLNNGLLVVSIPKVEQAKSRKIEIQ